MIKRKWVGVGFGLMIQLALYSASITASEAHAARTPSATECGRNLDNHLVEATREIHWSKVNPDLFLPTLKTELTDLKKKIKEIADQEAEPTFENTILALDFANERYERVQSIFSVYKSALKDDKIQKLEYKVNALSTSLTQAMLNKKLFKRIEKIYNDHRVQIEASQGKFQDEKINLIESSYLGFIKAGIQLKGAEKKRYIQITKRLLDLGTEFEQSLLHKDESLRVIVNDLSELEGVSENDIQEMSREAAAANLPGKWVIRFYNGMESKVLRNAKSSQLRKKVYYADSTFDLAKTVLSPEEINGAYDKFNEAVLLEIAALRKELARLVGYPNYAEYGLTDRMAKTPKEIHALYDELTPRVLAKAKDEVKELKEFAKQTDGVTELNLWDGAYYIQRLKKAHYSFNDDVIKKYFEVENTTQAVLGFIEVLFGIDFKPAPYLDLYSTDARGFDVYDTKNGRYLGTLVLDLYAREKKLSGAWASNIINQGLYSFGMQRPWVTVNMNVARPTQDEKAHFTSGELKTFFHELGHALHGLFSDVTYRALAGTNVPWDFVEFPSQVMEGWAYDKTFLKSFAKHTETAEIISDELIEKLQKSANFRVGTAYLGQAQLGILDLNWHLSGPNPGESVYDFDKRIIGDLRLFPDAPFIPSSYNFMHIFSWGYAMGYYSYYYADGIVADAFEYWNQPDFELRRKIAADLRREVLSKGGSQDPKLLYRNFRGRDFTRDAFFRSKGLTQGDTGVKN